MYFPKYNVNQSNCVLFLRSAFDAYLVLILNLFWLNANPSILVYIKLTYYVWKLLSKWETQMLCILTIICWSKSSFLTFYHLFPSKTGKKKKKCKTTLLFHIIMQFDVDTYIYYNFLHQVLPLGVIYKLIWNIGKQVCQVKSKKSFNILL